MQHNYRFVNRFWRITSFIITAVIIISLISPLAINQARAAVIPIPLYPVNYANTTPATDPPLGIPSFKWSSAESATSYRLQADTEIGFNWPISLDIITPNLSFTPNRADLMFADGEVYWRVRVESPTPVGDWSPVMRFTKTWATAENKPTLIAPYEGELLAFLDYPAFSWTPVIGASAYRFQIATNVNGFDSPVLSVDTITTAFQPNYRLSNQQYYWRIVPLDAYTHLGTPSTIQTFRASYGTYLTGMVPTLVSPADETFPTFTPTFHWTAIEGAEHYRLEYTSDETCDFSFGTSVETRQTFYTPTETFSNDFRYCWRVRVESGSAVGDWSTTWHFQKRWNLKPVLLTPVNLYQTGLYPVYSWTPVPGAATYYIQVATDPYFNTVIDQNTTANTSYAPMAGYYTGQFWWRVRPIDGNGKSGVNSVVSSFKTIADSMAPIQIYPQFYYAPNGYGQFKLEPHEDRSVAYPIFIWHRLMTPPPVGGDYATAYRIQIDETPYFDTVLWQYDTENTSASPTASHDFEPLYNQDYFWRVCPLNNSRTDCRKDPDTDLEWWSQVWTTQFTNTVELSSTLGTVPTLLRPDIGQESVEATPLLEWWPMQGAFQYQVEVSRDDEFLTNEITETVNIPAYAPVHSLAQRSFGRTDYGTYYWHVRGLMDTGWSGWSATWRFQIASQSEWRYNRTFGDLKNRLLVGSDPISDTLPTIYDLTSLNASQSEIYWLFGFTATITTTNMTYVLYLDMDNADKPGVPVCEEAPERSYHVTTIPEHRPEFVIYVDVVNGTISRNNTWVYQCIDGNWGYGQRFLNIGAYINNYAGYIELEVPYSAIGMDDQQSSTSLMLFSVDNSTGLLQDSAPSDPDVPHEGAGDVILSRFTSVSEHMNLIYPPSSVSGDPTIFNSFPPFYWDWPTGDNGATPFAGSLLQVDVDEDYTPPHEASLQINSNTTYLSEHNVTLLNDIVGDNIYYWRVQPIYAYPGNPTIFGAWTSGWSFRRLGLIPQNLTTSVTFATPTFEWDMSEGAEYYRLMVARDLNFGNIVIDRFTPMSTFTPWDTLEQGLYYWKVQVIRHTNIGNDWSDIQQFTLSLPTPTGLTPDLEIVHYAPTMCWDPLVGFDNGEPVFSAWKYHVQVSTDPSFGTTYEQLDTFNNCWTPTGGYQDGAYYWRVALIDGNGRWGSYSATATFTKQYPISTLVSPISGTVPKTPTFIWTPVDGATTYVVEVSWYPTFYPLSDGVETINTQYTPTIIYETDRAYYWRVAIRDRYGRQGPFNDASFIIGLGYHTFLPMLLK